MNGTSRPKEQWGTRIGVILAVAGSAVGLGTFLRFPGQAAQNGGGAFMIPYFCALLFLGIPICWAEWTMGKYGGRAGFNSAPGIFGAIGRRPFWRYSGVLGLLIPVVIYMYYVLIESWCLGYALSYLFGWIQLGNDPALWAQNSADHFANFVGMNSDGLVFGGKIHISVVLWVFTFAVNFLVIFRGLSRGIERFCMIAMPVMGVCALIVLVRVLTLGTPNAAFPERNVVNGLGFMWNPKPAAGGGQWYHALADPQVWMSAASQIFFSLSVGFGIILNYASYLRRRDDVVLSGLTASATNEFFEICLGGMITLPAAFIFLGADFPMRSSFDLGFTTLPVVFLHMPGGPLFGFLWFFALFLAAVTSSLSMLQPAIAFLEEGLSIGRRASVTILGMVTVLGSLFVIYFSKGLVALDTMDFWIGTAAIFVLATLQVVLYGWVLGVKRGRRVASEGAEIPLPRIFCFVIKYISPVYLLVVFVLWSWKNFPDYLKKLLEGGVPLVTVCVMAGVAVFFVLLIFLAGKKWKAEERGAALVREIEAEEHAEEASRAGGGAGS